MKKYKVEVLETTWQLEDVEAETEEQAIEKVKERYHNYELHSTLSDIETEFRIYEE